MGAVPLAVLGVIVVVDEIAAVPDAAGEFTVRGVDARVDDVHVRSVTRSRSIVSCVVRVLDVVDAIKPPELRNLDCTRLHELNR